MLAGLGTACGVGPLTCGVRALAGAAVLYVLTGRAVRWMLSLCVDAVASKATEEQSRKTPRESD